jgi:hypothetical protein
MRTIISARRWRTDSCRISRRRLAVGPLVAGPLIGSLLLVCRIRSLVPVSLLGTSRSEPTEILVEPKRIAQPVVCQAVGLPW